MKKILIIEDDAAFADRLKAELSAEHQVELCPDGQSGYYAIYEFKPDAVLLDLTIGQMGAVSLVGKIKAQKQFSRLPIFVLADHKTMALADEALAAGANEAFLKEEADCSSRVVSALTKLISPSLVRQIRRPNPEPAPALVPLAVAPPITQPRLEPAPMVAVPALTPPSRGSTISARPYHPVLPHGYEPQSAYFPAPEIERTLAEAAPFQGQQFMDTYGQKAHALRREFIAYRTAQGNDRKTIFEGFLKQVAAMRTDAFENGFKGLAMYLGAIETRVGQLLASLDMVTAPSLQIVAAALDVLAALDNHIAELRPLNNLTPHGLVVDDDLISRKALCLGLEKAKIKASGVDNPDSAIHEAEGTPFDIIFLDVELPKMNGFALCARLRLIPAHRKTPILFVTSLSDMKSRASSRVSGGNQFLSKPVNYPELTVNVWTLVIRKRILEVGRPEYGRV